MSENDTERTEAEQKVLDKVAKRKGEEYVEENAKRILAQARLVGDLPQKDD